MLFRSAPAAPQSLPPRATWIWNNQSAASPPGEKLAFRSRLELPDPVVHAVAVATADNEATMWVNGTKVGHTADWGKPFAEPITWALKPGTNEILVVAANADAVAEFRAGDDKVRKKKRGFLMGEAMKASKGQGNPQLLNRLLDERLG